MTTANLASAATPDFQTWMFQDGTTFTGDFANLSTTTFTVTDTVNPILAGTYNYRQIVSDVINATITLYQQFLADGTPDYFYLILASDTGKPILTAQVSAPRPPLF